MKYKLVLFDLDGTLMDTSKGIIHCYNETCKRFNKPVDLQRDFHGIIGGALLQNFVKYFEFSEQQAYDAVEFYRNEYATHGIHLADVYPGIRELLAFLKQNKVNIGVATLKREDFAISILKEFGLSDYFDMIKGMDASDTKTKSSIINECINNFNVSTEDTILVGDSFSDAKGAQKSEIDFAGVTYGWGFADKEDIRMGYHTYAADTICELKKYLI